MTEKAERVRMVMTNVEKESLNLLEGSNSVKSIKSIKEISTELNEKNVIKETNLKEDHS